MCLKNMMRIYTSIFLLFSSLNYVSAQNCSMLENGNYRVEFDDANNPNSVSTFKLQDKSVFFMNNNVVDEYELIQLGKCHYTLKSKEKIDESKFTDFQKMLIKQGWYYDITKVVENVYYFTMRVNLHIQCGSGRFVKLAD